MIYWRRHRVSVIIKEPRESEDYKPQLITNAEMVYAVPVDLFEWRRGLNLHRELLVPASPSPGAHASAYNNRI